MHNEEQLIGKKFNRWTIMAFDHIVVLVVLSIFVGVTVVLLGQSIWRN